MRQVFNTHTSLSLGALKWFTLASSSSARRQDVSTRKCAGMSRCSGRMNVRSAAARRARCLSARLSSPVTANVLGCSFVMRYFSKPSPEASSSSSLAPRHAGWPRNAPSVVVRNS